MSIPWYHRTKGPLLLLMALIILSIFTIENLPTHQDYEESIKFVVEIRHYGYDSETIEKSITIPLENEIAILQGIKGINSVSQRNISKVYLTIAKGANKGEFFINLRDIVNSFYQTLSSTVQKPRIYSSSQDSPIMVLAFRSNSKNLIILRGFVEDEIKPQIERIPGCGEIEITGAELEEIHLTADLNVIANMGINLSDIGLFIEANYGNVTSGLLRTSNKNIPVTLAGRLDQINDLNKLTFGSINNNPRYLSQIVNIHRKSRTAETVSRVNGVKQIVMTVQTSGRSSPREISRHVRVALEQFPGTEITILYDKGQEMADALYDTGRALLTGMTILFIFLSMTTRKLSNLILQIIILPVSVVVSIAVLAVLKRPVDIAVLTGIALGIGLIADSGIIISRIDPAVKQESLKGITPPLITSWGTTLLALIPIFFVPSLNKEFQTIVVTLAVLLTTSLFLGMIFIPPYIQKSNKKRGSKLVKSFWFIHSKIPLSRGIRSVIIGVLILISLGSVGIPRKEQPENSDLIIARYSAESGTNVNVVAGEIAKYSTRLLQIEGIKQTQSTARQGGGQLSIQFDSGIISRQKILELIEKIDTDLSNGFLYIDNKTVSERITIDLIGPDMDYSKKTVQEIAKEISMKEEFGAIFFHFKDDIPELSFIPDKELILNRRMRVRDIVALLRWGLHGPVSLKWIEEGGEVDLRIIGDKSSLNSRDDLLNILIKGEDVTVPLRGVGKIIETEGSGIINRINRQRAISFSVELNAQDHTTALRKLEEILNSKSLKLGHGFRIDPELRELKQKYNHLMGILGIVIVLIYMLLAAQTESFILPILVLITIPMGLSYPLLWIALRGKALNLYSIIALIVVTGLLVNNAIIIIHDLNTQTISHALRKRIPALTLTTTSTVCGLIPLMFPIFSSSKMMQTIAEILIVGLVGSYINTLLFFPVLLNKYHNSIQVIPK